MNECKNNVQYLEEEIIKAIGKVSKEKPSGKEVTNWDVLNALLELRDHLLQNSAK